MATKQNKKSTTNSENAQGEHNRESFLDYKEAAIFLLSNVVFRGPGCTGQLHGVIHELYFRALQAPEPPAPKYVECDWAFRGGPLELRVRLTPERVNPRQLVWAERKVRLQYFGEMRGDRWLFGAGHKSLKDYTRVVRKIDFLYGYLRGNFSTLWAEVPAMLSGAD